MDVRQLGILLRKTGYIARREGASGRRGYILLENSAESVNAQRKLLAAGPADMPI
jgi:hypothetical protein